MNRHDLAVTDAVVIVTATSSRDLLAVESDRELESTCHQLARHFTMVGLNTGDNEYQRPKVGIQWRHEMMARDLYTAAVPCLRESLGRSLGFDPFDDPVPLTD